MLAYLGWAGLSYLWSIDPAATSQSLFYLSTFFILAFVAAQLATDSDHVKTLIFASVAAGTVISILGLLQVLGFEPFNIKQISSPASTFGNRNHAAQYLNLIVPISFFLFISTKESKGYWLLGIATGINIAYLLNTYSRGSWIAFIVVLLVFGYLTVKNQPARQELVKRLKQRKAPLILVVIIPVCFFILPDKHTDVLDDNKLTVNTSVHIRLKSYANATSAVADNPLRGLGHGGFMLGFRKYMFDQAPLTETTENLYLVNLHNDFLQEFVELGTVGGLLFIVFYLWLLVIAWQNTSNKSTSLSLYSIGIFLALIAVGVHSLVSFPFHRPTSAMEFWLLTGIVIGLNGKEFKLPDRYANTIYIALMICVSALLAYSIFNSQHYFKNSAQTLLLKEHLKNKDCETSLNVVENIDYKVDYYTKIYVPLTYNLCYQLDPEKSFTRTNEILAYDPHSSIARITRGIIYLDMNSPLEAAQDFLDVTKVLPHRPTAYVGLGHAAVKMGKTHLAIEMYQKALSLDENNVAAQEMLEKLQTIKP